MRQGRRQSEPAIKPKIPDAGRNPGVRKVLAFGPAKKPLLSCSASPYRPQVGRLEVLIFRRAGAGVTAEAVIKQAERFQQALLAGGQVRIGKRGLGNGEARGQFLDMRRPSPDSGGKVM